MKQSIKISPGWIEAPLRKLATYIQRGKSPKYADYSDLPVINQKCVRWNGVNYDFVKYIHPDQSPKWAKERFLQCKDLLWNSTGTGTIGRACLYKQSDTPTVADSHITIVRAHQGCLLPEYLHYFVMSPFVQKQINEMQNGSTNQVELSKGTIEEMRLPIAPLAEQKRIVDKIARLFSYLDEGERLLEQVKRQISTYRQAVLKAAVTGELTKEWRATNGDKLDGGKELLQRILQERRKSWQGRGKYNEPVAPDASSLSELPEGWTWTSVDSLICSGPTNGISPKISENGLVGVPSFKLSATTRGEFLITNETIKNIDLEPDKAEKYWLSPGDLLVQRGNSIEYVGTAALFQGPDRTYVYPDLMMKVRPVQSVLGQWMTFCINSRYGRNYIQRKATGTAGSMPKINGDALRYLPIPLPPLDEIEKLIQVLTGLQSYCANHEKEAQLNLRRIDHLRQSILKSAFSGELVGQDPNEEPASELLARIQQEEQKQAKTSTPRSGRTSKRSASV